jgi:pimeloyl-ACP methyl ester carboxylesterase
VPGPPVTAFVVSADGTRLAVDQSGSGPPVVLVHGALTGRRHPLLADVATRLAAWFTVLNYDRRGRGDSANTSPYAVERELDDLEAVVDHAGGAAMVFGGSSGAALALRGAGRSPQRVTRLALWEPPYHVGADAPPLPDDFADRLDRLVVADRRDEAVELFMTAAAEVPPAAIPGLRSLTMWAEAVELAHTLAYEAHAMGPGNALPKELLARVPQPSLVLHGGASPGWISAAALAVAHALPHAEVRCLPGQTHGVGSSALVPDLLEVLGRP